MLTLGAAPLLLLGAAGVVVGAREGGVTPQSLAKSLRGLFIPRGG